MSVASSAICVCLANLHENLVSNDITTDYSHFILLVDTSSSEFSNSPNRQLEKWISDVFPDERRKMKEMGQTQWVKHHEVFDVFSDLFLHTIICLEALAQCQPAGSHISHCCWPCHNSPSVSFVLTQNVLSYTKRD